MNNKIFLLASVLVLLACTDDNSSVGGTTVDPNAVTAEVLSGWYNFGTGLPKDSVSKLTGGTLAIYSAGARAECSADGTTLKKTIQFISYGDSSQYVVYTFQASGLGNVCDSTFNAFKTKCAALNGLFFGSACQNDSIEAACRATASEGTFELSALQEFENDAADACSELSKNADSTSGRIETPSSSSINSESSSSSAGADDSCTVNCVSSSSKDTLVEIDENATLSNYTAQFKDVPEKYLSDSLVLAYNGNGCKYIQSVNSVLEITRDQIADCFPMTDSLMKRRSQVKDCKYYLTGSDDGAQPTGHILSKVSSDGIAFTTVSTGGVCMKNQNFFTVAFLIEDCNNLISEKTPVTNSVYTSGTWKCEDGTYSPGLNVKAYGEWFNEKLLGE